MAKKIKINQDNQLDLLNIEWSTWFVHGTHLSRRLLYLGSSSDSEDGMNIITPKTSESIAKGIIALESIDSDAPIFIVMNTMGGSVYEAMLMYDMIKSTPCPVVIMSYGSCMSAGTVILQAADVRLLAHHTTFMIHDGTDGYIGDVRDFENWASHGKEQRKLIYKIYASRSKKPVEYWEKLCANDMIMSARQAIKLGLADGFIPYSKKAPIKVKHIHGQDYGNNYSDLEDIKQEKNDENIK